MEPTPSQIPLTVAISSRALFNFEEENTVFEEQNDRHYMSLQWARLNQPAKPGVAFNLVKKLLRFNQEGQALTEVVVLSRNDPVSGLRIYHSIAHHQLKIERAVFTRGRSPYKYLHPLKASLFLSANTDDVEQALRLGCPAAHVYPFALPETESQQGNELRIAFDGDAVLFSDEAERIYQKEGLVAFVDHEKKHAATPLSPGPFKPFLEALVRLREKVTQTDLTIRTALVTARSAPAHERAIRTLKSWNIEIDEAMFLGGLKKTDFLAAFSPDFFFDDQTRNCQDALSVSPTGHVRSGITNEPNTATT